MSTACPESSMSRVRVGRIIIHLCVAATVPALVAATEATAVHARMVEIEKNLAYGATSRDTFYLYRPAGLPADSLSLVPCLFNAGGTLTLMATAHHVTSRKRGSVYQIDSMCAVDSIELVVAGSSYKAARRSGTGIDDFAADPDFRAAAVNTPENQPIRVKLYDNSRVTEFLMSNQERRAWSDLWYYRRNFDSRSPMPWGKPEEPRDPASDTGGALPTTPFIHVMPRLVRSVVPLYPDQARMAGIKGRPVVEVLLDASGTVRTAIVLHKSGNLQLDRAAVRAALDCVFTRDWPRGGTRRLEQRRMSMPFRFTTD